jgi:hypothetical protein
MECAVVQTNMYARPATLGSKYCLKQHSCIDSIRPDAHVLCLQS